MPGLAPVTPFASVRRADNPGPMTLDGTRSYVLRAPGAPSAVVVDPGPDDAVHLGALASGPVELVLVTHRHADHTAGSTALHAMTGSPVRAADLAHCHGASAAPLRGGEVIEAAGLRIEVLATPGHTADSVSFVVRAPGEDPVVLTGDTVLGRGTTVIAAPDGSLGDYLASLDVLERAGDGRRGLPAHGPVIEDLGTAVRAYREHRLERLDQVRAVLAELGSDATVGDVVARVYADVDASVIGAARQSVAAQLHYLRTLPSTDT
ncbi:MBL fold metallo-hydrolase [Isoptericola halotolerans]|uniref:Glyoxylase-like metal-dependent hydrolase (Beta-lactamase superfamily II) n=1 Tax=Isoptericola halotolerans TaxID=300560 RepID=A0ABX1ZZ11_9MICO|nr:MBL fold metallo-hydrolase [Isoptericola halotolerans]NOV95845.1 glyoxylase-like metal-dependent hydrolase (beta-lactamase superfamily II) [Isoptericola halotolerans]